MYIVRPALLNDLDALVEFANSISLGMLSLPKDRSLLKKKIERSLHAFSKTDLKLQEDLYLFILENTLTKKSGGCAGIYAKTGLEHPIFYYRVETISPQKSHLPLPKEIKILHPTRETNGPSELCALFIEKEHRKEKLGELLSLSRLLFIAEHPNRFDNTLFARLRGFINKEKMTSPFWDGFGKHFLNMEFKEAQELHSRGTEFIAEFLPKYPIYTSLLPKMAQRVIQKTHITTKPALKMLEKEGFRLNDQVDILEGGPVVEAKTLDVRTIKHNILAKVSDISTAPIDSPPLILSNTSLDFRACYGTAKLKSEKTAVITRETAAALNLNTGDSIRLVTTH